MGSADSPLSTLPARTHSPITLVLVAAALLLGGVGGYAVAMSRIGNFHKNTAATPTIAPTGMIASTEDSANWKTYTSAKAEYVLKYPPGWSAVDITPQQSAQPIIMESLLLARTYTTSPRLGIASVVVMRLPTTITSLDGYVETFAKGNPAAVDIISTTVGNERAIAYRTPGFAILQYDVVRNSLLYSIRLNDSTEANKQRDESIRIFNEIVATLKFTK